MGQRIASIFILLIILLPAALTDYERQRIPNLLSMSGWVIGPVVAWGLSGVDGGIASLGGLGLMLALLVPFWMLGWFGAADVKLMGSVGALVGVHDALPVMFSVACTGFIMAIVVLLFQRRLLEVVGEMLNITKTAVHNADTSNSSGEEKRIVLPYAIPIAFGTMLYVLYQQL